MTQAMMFTRPLFTSLTNSTSIHFPKTVANMFVARYLSSLNPFSGGQGPDAKPRVQKSYHKKATGAAAQTVKRHAREHEFKLFGSCFCPFVQRVWIALELKGVAYQYVEVDPYKKPQTLLEVNPLGLVPALRHSDWACHESTVLVEYVRSVHHLPPSSIAWNLD